MPEPRANPPCSVPELVAVRLLLVLLVVDRVLVHAHRGDEAEDESVAPSADRVTDAPPSTREPRTRPSISPAVHLISGQ